MKLKKRPGPKWAVEPVKKKIFQIYTGMSYVIFNITGEGTNVRKAITLAIPLRFLTAGDYCKF
jgi:hypothetical protein